METSCLPQVSDLNLKDCSCTCLLIMGDTLIISTTIGTLLQFSLKTKVLDQSSQTSMNTIDCMAQIDNSYFVIAGLKIEIWQVPLKFYQIYKTFSEESAVGISIVQDYLYIAMEESGVKKLDIRNNSEETLYEHSSLLISFDLLNLNNKISIASACIDNELIVYENIDRKTTFPEKLFSVKFEQYGKYVLCGSMSGKIFIFSVDQNQVITIVEAHDARVKSIAVGKIHQIFVSGSFDQTAKVYFVNELEPAGTILGHHDWIQSVAISEDYKIVITGGADNMIKIWDYSSLHSKAVTKGCGLNFLCSFFQKFKTKII